MVTCGFALYLANVSGGEEFRGLVVRPGDTVVVSLPESTPLEELNTYAELLHAALPADVNVVVLPAPFAVYSPDASPMGAPCGQD